jgi:DNA-binding NarL/FixJ family response regulator
MTGARTRIDGRFSSKCGLSRRREVSPRQTGDCRKELRIGLSIAREFIRRSVQASLQENGFRAQVFSDDRQELLKQTCDRRPDLLIIDLDRADSGSAIVCNVIACVRLSVIVIMRREQWHAVPALRRAGVRGYLFDSCTALELERAIVEVSVGQTYYSKPVESWLQRHFYGRPQEAARIPDRLTKTEQRIVQLLSADIIESWQTVNPR